MDDSPSTPSISGPEYSSSPMWPLGSESGPDLGLMSSAPGPGPQRGCQIAAPVDNHVTKTINRHRTTSRTKEEKCVQMTCTIHAWTMDIKMIIFSSLQDFETILDPISFVYASVPSLGGVKSIQMILLYSNTICKPSVVSDRSYFQMKIVTWKDFTAS